MIAELQLAVLEKLGSYVINLRVVEQVPHVHRVGTQGCRKRWQPRDLAPVGVARLDTADSRARELGLAVRRNRFGHGSTVASPLGAISMHLSLHACSNGTSSLASQGPWRF